MAARNTFRETAETQSGRILTATAERVGIHFGFVGIVRARNGRQIHETVTYPFPEAALRAAVDWIETQA